MEELQCLQGLRRELAGKFSLWNYSRNKMQGRRVRREKGTLMGLDTGQFSGRRKDKYFLRNLRKLGEFRIMVIFLSKCYVLWTLSTPCISFHGRMLKVLDDQRYVFWVVCRVPQVPRYENLMEKEQYRLLF